MKVAIIIPARYGSTRFPGKPLVKIAGETMLSRVVAIGRTAADAYDGDAVLLVATEDQRIADHCAEIGVDCVLTSDECHTGSDRVLEAAQKSGDDFDFVIGLQGDAPFTPADAIPKMLAAAIANPNAGVVTPVVKLRWSELDALREAKTITPFSGTTAILGNTGKALWFSKNIIPAIRKEETMRAGGDDQFSPVHQHIGLYGFRYDILKTFKTLPQGHYEQLEGLEQLRLLENGIEIQTVTLDVEAGLAQAGIDSPEDVERAEKLLAGAA
ncbi:MAG TPA: 3-deoxy-manno-octulosonate cytidylyltransferase [Micavibrio sp.]|nr:3-deoxy-manno-octulosonate cytidylyltransferase [Micavibrio sp.]HIL28971.1 3-deoxy-manno-octulosonate cytidylyltransferase [Micavibrio sp.]